MHVEIGSTVSGISMYSYLANQHLNESNLNGLGNSLEVIQNTSKEVVDKLKDIIWLNTSQENTLENLWQRLIDYAHQMAKPKNIRVESKQNIIDQSPIDEIKKRTIYLICKEAINNAVKYSDCKNLELNLSEEANRLKISIKDDGIGFAPQNEKGNGLNNMRDRARSIGANLSIRSIVGKGTSIEVLLLV